MTKKLHDMIAAGFALVHAGAFCAAGANAASYPERPIRLIVGFAPGGVDDYVARVLAPRLTEAFGQTVIVDNRPGAAGTVGAEIIARANADGYTLSCVGSITLASAPGLFPKFTHDLMRDFTYVARVATGVQVLVAHPSVPARTVPELVALARSGQKPIRYGSGGVGTPGHLAMELLRSRTGMDVLHIPYKGGGPNAIALASGEVEIGLPSVAAAMPMISSKRLNALAVASTKRSAVLPGVPTVAESGFPGFDVTNNNGIVAPARTPASIIKRVNAELRKIVESDDARAKLMAQGLEPAASTPEEYRAIMQAEVTKWGRVIRDAKITAN